MEGDWGLYATMTGMTQMLKWPVVSLTSKTAMQIPALKESKYFSLQMYCG